MSGPRVEMKEESVAGEREYFNELFIYTEDEANKAKLKTKQGLEEFSAKLSDDAKKYAQTLNTRKALLQPIKTRSDKRSGVLTYTNCETREIENFDALYESLKLKHGLNNVKLEGEIAIIEGEEIPQLTLHKSSGNENEETRKLEDTFLQDFVAELLKKFKRVHTYCDTQEKPFKHKVEEVEVEVKNDKGEVKVVTECRLKLESKNGRMVLSDAVSALLNRYTTVAVSDFRLADGINTKQRGKSVADNAQQTKAQDLIPDACIAFMEFVSKDNFPADRKNSDVVKDYVTPSIESTRSFNNENVPDHPDVDRRTVINKKKLQQKGSGDLAQSGIKGFSPAGLFYKPSAIDPKTNNKYPHVLDAEDAYTIKLYQIFINKLSAHVVSNGDKIPAYPTKASKGEKLKTNDEIFAEFMQTLANVGITKPTEITFDQMSIVLQSGDKQRKLATQLEKLLSSQAIDSDTCNKNLTQAFDVAAQAFFASKEYKDGMAYKLNPLTPDEEKRIVAMSNEPSRTQKRSSFQTFIEKAINCQLMGGFPTVHGKSTYTKENLLDAQENRKVESLVESTLKDEIFYGATTEASDDQSTRPSAKRLVEKTKMILTFADDLRMHLLPQPSFASGRSGSFSPKSQTQQTAAVETPIPSAPALTH